MNNKRNRYTSRYNLGGKKMYQQGGLLSSSKQAQIAQANQLYRQQQLLTPKSRFQTGGMYGDNQIPAGIGSTAMSMYQESDPRLQEQREKSLVAEQEKLTAGAAQMKQEIEADKLGDEQKIAAASQDKIGAGVGAVSQGVDLGIQSGIIPTKESATPENPFSSAIGAYKGVRTAKQTMKTVEGFNKAKTAYEVGQRLKMGEQAYKMGQVGKNLGNLKIGTDAATTASTGFGAGLKGAELATTVGKDGYMAASQGTQALAKGSAIGAGLKNFASSGAGLGTIASLAGRGVSKWSDDDDATTMNFGEGAGATLSGIGTGLGAAATAGMVMGSAVPVVGNIIGAGLGAAYGLGKGLVQRNKARKEKTKLEQDRQVKIDKYSKELTGNLAMHKGQVRAGNLRQKTYSGYDLGRNVVAQMGGMRMGTPRYGY